VISRQKYRRLQRDMIQVFKITHNILVYDETVSPHRPFYARANTRGSNYKLVNHFFNCDLCKHFLSEYSVNIRSSLLNSSTTNAFKARLDKFWLHQAVKYNFTVDLTGTGNRSEEVIKR